MVRRTRTSSFGVSGRASHDSTPFYSRKLYKDIGIPKPSPEDLVENEVPEEFLDKIVWGTPERFSGGCPATAST